VVETALAGSAEATADAARNVCTVAMPLTAGAKNARNRDQVTPLMRFETLNRDCSRTDSDRSGATDQPPCALARRRMVATAALTVDGSAEMARDTTLAAITRRRRSCRGLTTHLMGMRTRWLVRVRLLEKTLDISSGVVRCRCARISASTQPASGATASPGKPH